MSPFKNGTNCRLGRIVAFWNLGRIVAFWNLGRIVAFWNLGRIVAWDELSPNHHDDITFHAIMMGGSDISDSKDPNYSDTNQAEFTE